MCYWKLKKVFRGSRIGIVWDLLAEHIMDHIGKFWVVQLVVWYEQQTRRKWPSVVGRTSGASILC